MRVIDARWLLPAGFLVAFLASLALLAPAGSGPTAGEPAAAGSPTTLLARFGAAVSTLAAAARDALTESNAEEEGDPGTGQDVARPGRLAGIGGGAAAGRASAASVGGGLSGPTRPGQAAVYRPSGFGLASASFDNASPAQGTPRTPADVLQEVGLQPVTGGDGEVVGAVPAPGTRWEQAGLRPGDVIIAIDDVPIQSISASSYSATRVAISPTLKLTVTRGGETVWLPRVRIQ